MLDPVRTLFLFEMSNADMDAVICNDDTKTVQCRHAAKELCAVLQVNEDAQAVMS
jgi:hypothetical protein